MQYAAYCVAVVTKLKYINFSSFGPNKITELLASKVKVNLFTNDVTGYTHTSSVCRLADSIKHCPVLSMYHARVNQRKLTGRL